MKKILVSLITGIVFAVHLLLITTSFQLLLALLLNLAQ